jgi:nitrogen fixation protein
MRHSMIKIFEEDLKNAYSEKKDLEEKLEKAKIEVVWLEMIILTKEQAIDKNINRLKLLDEEEDKE